MSSRAIVRRRSTGQLTNRYSAVPSATVRNLLRMADRRRRQIARGIRQARDVQRRARDRRRWQIRRGSQQKKYKRIVGNAAGTTYTTNRMIVRKTPRQQKFLRKMFKNGSNVVKHVNRFGFNWIGAVENNRTIWYSVCHNKFNNLYEYLEYRNVDPNQSTGDSYNTGSSSVSKLALNPANFVYLGKCTFNYELYNPTNYIITVFIYDLVCKHDTPYEITYGPVAANVQSSAPEQCMQYSTYSHAGETTSSGQAWYLGDPTKENNNTAFNSIGMKPTDYYGFNALWKVKGMKKIILPPGSSHHHVVIFNPKKKVTLGNLLYPRMDYLAKTNKYGVAGLTQATLFGFEGQIATNVPTSVLSAVGFVGS